MKLLPKNLLIKQLRKISNIKDYSQRELVKILDGVNIPHNYSEEIFSRALKDIGQTDNPEQEEIISANIKDDSYRLSSSEYNKIFKDTPFGSYQRFLYKSRIVSLFGIDYSDLSAKEIWKMIYLTSPEIILLTVKPDDMLEKFTFDLKNPKNGTFSERKYFDQLTYSNEKIGIKSALFQSVRDELESLIENDVKEAALQTNFVREEFVSTDKLTDRAIFSAMNYSNEYHLPLILADIPDIILRQKLINIHTTTQLKQIFKISSSQAWFSFQQKPATPLNRCNSEFSDFFLNESNIYLQNILEYLIARFPFKKITILSGINQSKSFLHILNKRKISSIQDCLSVPALRRNLLNNSHEDYIEKNAIYEVLKYGSLISGSFSRDTAYRLFKNYFELNETDPEFEKVTSIYSQFIKKYVEELIQNKELANQEISKGVSKKILDIKTEYS